MNKNGALEKFGPFAAEGITSQVKALLTSGTLVIALLDTLMSFPIPISSDGVLETFWKNFWKV